jgi:proteasome assembly chaperone (PAC2) family protein
VPYVTEGELPALVEPVLVVVLSGWIDASGAAAAAAEHVASQIRARTFLTFDDDTFIDFRARRPVMKLRDSVISEISWSTPVMRHGRDETGRDVVLLTGPEPDTAWRLFARTVADICTELGVTTMIGLGAYPFGAPHTRPVGMTATSPSAETVARLGLARTSLDAPAGAQTLLEQVLAERGIEAFGLWAQVPHYVASMAYPAASAALVEALNREAQLTIDPAALRREATIQRERLDHLVAANDDHSEMLKKLEAAHDAVAPPIPALDQPIPSVDEIAAEVEQFLRDQQDRNQ